MKFTERNRVGPWRAFSASASTTFSCFIFPVFQMASFNYL
jgi:hypothetical protein